MVPFTVCSDPGSKDEQDRPVNGFKANVLKQILYFIYCFYCTRTDCRLLQKSLSRLYFKVCFEVLDSCLLACTFLPHCLWWYTSSSLHTLLRPTVRPCSSVKPVLPSVNCTTHASMGILIQTKLPLKALLMCAFTLPSLLVSAFIYPSPSFFTSLLCV